MLGEEEWPTALTTGEWLSYDPLHGDPIAQKTTVWVTYDDDFLYFAFRCDDPEPGAIKTSITRRDNIWQDDWVGLSLDALGTGQTSYHMMLNPSGVQMDMLNTIAGREDHSPDWIWDSAGRLTDTGYVVELRLPLQSIRFAGGQNTRMGILFWRRVSRLGMSVSWPALAPNAWVFERHASLGFDHLEPRMTREILPSATYSRSSLRESPTVWGVADGRGEVGVSTKFGLTSTITLDATVNPDFSQVESDSFQVEVNQRFPIFFDEKRPFFMEGAGIFRLAGAGGDNSLLRAVHTRRIVDPVFGAKLTGSAGRFTFGTLTAVDESARRDFPDGTPESRANRLFNIGRVQYSLGSSSYVGGLFADTSFAGQFNRVAGLDLQWRVNETQNLNAFALLSQTRAGRGVEPATAVGVQAGYGYNTEQWNIGGDFEHYDDDFEMATAFLRRVGTTGGWAFVGRNFYPDKDKHPWVQRVSFAWFTQGGRDRNVGGNELLTIPSLRMNLTRQGFVLVGYIFGFERWAGQRFERGRPQTFATMQVFRWLNVNAGYSQGLAVFYADNPFQGWSRDYSAGLTFQPDGRFSQSINYQRVAFERESTREDVFTLDIVNTRTTYQFSRSLAVRAIAQYDSSRQRVLTDFLGSYEPRPGTVVYAGYGSLIERRDFVNGQWQPGEGTFRTTQRGLFFKASYLYRF